MRIRAALFALLVACGSGDERTAQVTARPTPRAPIAATPVVSVGSVALPAVTPISMPLEQVPAPWTLTASDGSGLVATRIEAKAVVQGPLAFTELHLYFANTENRIREGTFAITLPSGAAVSRFAMESNGHWMEAEVVEKQVARRAYEDFLHRKQDPALMEKAPGNQFTARVFPIEAKSVKHVVVSFSQELPGERYVLPLRGLPKVGQVDVELAVTNLDGKRETQTLDKRDWQPESDFVSTAPTAAEAISSGQIVVAQVSPFDQSSVATDVPSAMTLLVDTSASRSLGFGRYAGAVRELVASLASRYPSLVIDVVAFDQDTQSIYTGPASGFGAQQVAALEARGAAGASDLAQALASVQLKERVTIITDGVLTAGDTPNIKALAEKQVGRVDVVLAGGIRDQALATSLVTSGLPRSGAVFDLDRNIADVAAGLGERVLTDIDIEVAGATWVYPRTIKSARPNQRLMVYARFDQPQQSIDVKIGKSRRAVLTVGGTPALVERATAAAEIGDLEAKLADAKPAETKALRTQIIQKAVAARVISSQTSMLVLESDGDYARFGIDRKSLADILVVGPNGVEQKNRTYVASKSRRQAVQKQQEEKFALKDTTGKNLADKGTVSKESSAPNAPSGMGSPGGVEGDFKTKDDADARTEMLGQQGVATRQERERSTRAERMRAVRISPNQLNNPLAPDEGPPDHSQPPASQFPPDDAPPALKGKLAEIDRAIRRGKLEDALAKAQAWHTAQPGDVLALIGLGEVLEAKKDLPQAARVYGSIIDLFPGRADLRRFAGERLERIGETARPLAVDTYRRAVEERPDHMTGHRLLAYALLRTGKHAEAFAAILKGLEQRYPDGRFEGGERVLTEDAGLIGAAYLAAAPDKKAEIIAALRKHKAQLSTRSSTRFIMYWETDANDVDFHIMDAQGGHAFYSNPQLESGGELYADITTGYGPECFTIMGRPTAGPYKLSINYYSQGPMGYGMGLLQIIKHDGKGKLDFQDRPYVIMNDRAYVNLGTFK